MRFWTTPRSVTFMTNTVLWDCMWLSSSERRMLTPILSFQAGGQRWDQGKTLNICISWLYLFSFSFNHTLTTTCVPLFLLPPVNLVASRLCLYSAAWPLAATSVAACVAAVTAAVENVSRDLGMARIRSFMCPPRTWRLSCNLTREVRRNFWICQRVVNNRRLDAKQLCYCLSNRGWWWPHSAATVGNRDNPVNIRWALLLPHWHRLQLTHHPHPHQSINPGLWSCLLPCSTSVRWKKGAIHLSTSKERESCVVERD